MKQRINAESRESLQEYGLGHFFSNEWSHFAKELNEEVGREKKRCYIKLKWLQPLFYSFYLAAFADALAAWMIIV